MRIYRRTSSGLFLPITRRQALKLGTGLFASPLLLGSNCTPEQIDIALKIALLALQLTERIVGIIEAQNRSSAEARFQAKESIFKVDADGTPVGDALDSGPEFTIAVPPASTIERDMTEFEPPEVGAYKVLLEGAGGFFIESKVVNVSN